MEFYSKKKLSRTTVAMLCCLAALTGLSSCDKDLDPWEIVSLEVESSSQDATISHDGGTFTIDVNSNTKWTVEAPEWITVDKTSGEGKATINVNVAENKSNNSRQGELTITAKSDNAESNIIGQKTSTITVTQDQGIIIKMISSKIERIQYDDYEIASTNNKPYYYHRYKATIQYEIKTSLTDAELAEIAKDPYILVNLDEWMSYLPINNNKYINESITIKDIPFTRGTHTVTGETEERRWGNTIRYANVKLYWTDSSNDKQTAFDYTFDPEDSFE